VPAGWTARQVAELANIPARTVQYWRKEGVIGPTFLYAPGPGGVVYSFADVVAHRVFEDLVRGGVPRDIAVLAAQDVAQYTAGGSVAPFASPSNWSDEARSDCEADGSQSLADFERSKWLIVPLVDPGEHGDYAAESIVLLRYGSSLPDPAILEDQLKRGSRVVKIDDATVAYPIARVVAEVSDRATAYMRKHHMNPDDMPYWMLPG